MNRKVALFDLDGSLADFDAKMRIDLGVEEHIDVHDLDEDLKDPFMATPQWWFNLPPITKGFEVLKLATDIGFEIHILTCGPRRFPLAWTEKLLWVQKHLNKDIPVHITRDKSLVRGTVLYDDYPGFVDPWLKVNKKSVVIMPDRRYNKDYTHPRCYRDTNLQEVKEVLLKAYD